MAQSHRAPKQWCLTKNQTVNTFENWRQNLKYLLSLDPNFAPFLVDDAAWHKKSRADPTRGFVDDPVDVPVGRRRTALQKVTQLELMLGQVANYCPIISRNTIVQKSTSMGHIWNSIRAHYGFQNTGAHMMDFVNIKLEIDERPEDLFQRLMAFFEDNLLSANNDITHHGERVTEEEELSPSMENLIVLIWLQLIHRDLPGLVKQRYGTELRSKTLASIKPEISQALSSLLGEIHASDDAKVMRTAGYTFPARSRRQPRKEKPARGTSRNRPTPTCPLCKQAGRPSTDHFLSTCTFLPEKDRLFMTRARMITSAFDQLDLSVDPDEEACSFDEEEPPSQNDFAVPATTRYVQVQQSPFLHAYFQHHPLKITLDSGAETNMIKESVAYFIGARIEKTSQSALQADGRSPLAVVGEIHETISRGPHSFLLEALVVRDMDVDVLAGVPFMHHNDITVRPAKHQVILRDGSSLTYGERPSTSSAHVVRRAQAHILRAPVTTTVWPGSYLELDVPDAVMSDAPLALEPRTDTHRPSSDSVTWPVPSMISTVAGKIRIPNHTSEPQIVPKNAHFAQLQPTFVPPDELIPNPDPVPVRSAKCTTGHSADVIVDPDCILPEAIRTQFHRLHGQYDHLFNPKFTGYNGSSGNVSGVVNMGPILPPQRKGRLPQYNKNKLQELQSRFDELEELGVFVKPEDVSITGEYLNPSFLVKKPSGGTRLVTAFADVGRYSKPQPSLMPDVDTTLRQIACWKYVITTDLVSAFYQIPLSPESMKYCGVVTPFKGVRLYARCAMGMPGSETALEELMCRILGDLLQEGVVAKIADDLYCGGSTPEEALSNWKRVLDALSRNSIHISAKKTVVCPKSTIILGWVWSQGTLSASTHKITALATCSPPDTVKGVRSFVGAYKVLSRVLKGCAQVLAPLEEVVAGKQSSAKIAWSDELIRCFRSAQDAITQHKSITLPTPEDTLWIVTDGAVKHAGLGSTLYVTRPQDTQPRLAGFFSAKLRKRQMDWIPCEIEALCIAASIKHFSPYIIQSSQQASILTDSRPCVQAFEKLCRGEFSASSRVTSFLSAVSRYQISIRHLAGSANLPSDFACRNAPQCDQVNCQICEFVARLEESTVRAISVKDIIEGRSTAPFLTRSAWLQLQSDCPDLRKCATHLRQGTRPSKKVTNARDVKRYLNSVTIAADGMIVVKKNQPFANCTEGIVIPRQVLHGFLTALHIRLDHPTAHQLKLVANRNFFALDLDRAIHDVTDHCHMCMSLRSLPTAVPDQASQEPPAVVGISFAADVLRQHGQYVLVIRETVTSYLLTCLVPDEKGDTLRDGLIQLVSPIRPLDGPVAVIRADPAPGFATLSNDTMLKHHRISLEIGRVKNPNKNPVAERAIQELEQELLRLEPLPSKVTPVQLAVATARLNSRVRSSGLSSREMLLQRDQFNNHQIPLDDQKLIQAKDDSRARNHPHSIKAKQMQKGHSTMLRQESVNVGDIVYIASDTKKDSRRSRYIVTAIDGP